MHKERINYIKNDKGTYTGYAVNLPMIIGQANSLEELKANMKEIGLFVVQHYKEMFEQDEPFELKELTREEWFDETAKDSTIQTLKIEIEWRDKMIEDLKSQLNGTS